MAGEQTPQYEQAIGLIQGVMSYNDWRQAMFQAGIYNHAPIVTAARQDQTVRFLVTPDENGLNHTVERVEV